MILRCAPECPMCAPENIVPAGPGRERPMKVAAVKAPGGLDKLVIEERAQPVAGPRQLAELPRLRRRRRHAARRRRAHPHVRRGRRGGRCGRGRHGLRRRGPGPLDLLPQLGDGRPGPGTPHRRSRRPRRRLRGGVRRHAGPGLHPHARRLVLRRGGDPALRGPHRLARPDGRGADQARRRRPDPGDGRGLDLRPPAGQGGRRDGHLHLLLRREAGKAQGPRRGPPDQLSPDPGMGRRRRRPHRRPGRRRRGGDRRGRHPRPVGHRHPDRRPRLADRRPGGFRRRGADRPDHVQERHREGRHRRLAAGPGRDDPRPGGLDPPAGD
uniref:Uncharacterized protein n=1 Tax=uncultured bacterium CBNPD1 BAC clone 1664 TaxID=417310 RepID=B1N6N5_9BACT|nr:hypothetical protein [uncultured bacterium CBNPD1 BAC clone 1664]